MPLRATALATLTTLTAMSACSSGPPSAPPPPVPVTAAPPAPAAFDVDEWGLLDVLAPDRAALLAGPPGGPTNGNAPRRKPVLYFHLAAGAAPVDLTVNITTPPAAPPAGIVEHFPAGDLAPDAHTLTWTGLHLRPGGCHVAGAPTRDAPACHTPDGQCEAAELPSYETADATCLARAGATFNHLFYRAAGPPPPLPFDVAIADGALTITHARAADLVGPILYVHNDQGTVTVTALAPPALGQALRIAPPTGTDVAAATRALDAMMTTAGLTADERAAFNRAWASDLFGAGAAPARRGAIVPRDYLLYAMPASLVDGASQVTITPAPRALHRFMLIRVHV
jgi:hypothetical protein